MAAPTISAYSNSNLAGGSGVTARTTGSVSWSIGDLVIVLGGSDENTTTISTPTTTGSGIALSALTSFPSNTGSTCKMYGWSAVATASSSGTFSTNISLNTSAGGLAVLVVSGSDGVGNTSVTTGDTTDAYTTSLIRAGNNSAVFCFAADWSAVSDASTDPSPLSGSTQRVGDNGGFFSGQWNAYVATWADEGAAGTTAYGVTGVAGSKMSIGAVEVKGSAGGGGAFIPAANKPIQQAVKRASYW